MWHLLGITPTQDLDTIRSAFKAQLLALKRAGLHEDARHVQPLRDAYQQALRQAEQPQAKPWLPDPADAAGTSPPDAAQAPPDGAATDYQEAAGHEPTAPPDHETLRAHGHAMPEMPPSVDSPTATPPEPAATLSAEPATVTAGEWAARAEAAIQQLMAEDALPAQLPQCLWQLWQQPQWQAPLAAAALEDAIATQLIRLVPLQRAHQPPSPAVVQAMRQTRQWLAVLNSAALHYRWWPPRPAGPGSGQVAASSLWMAACAITIDLQLQLLHRRRERAACANLKRWLRHAVMQPLDSRSSWLSALALHLRQWPDPPAEWVDTLVSECNLHELLPGEHPEPDVDALVCLHHQQRQGRLLQRIAHGQLAHDTISPQVAASLLQPDITPANRRAVRTGQLLQGKTWLDQVRSAIGWLEQHAPEALDATEPRVLRWWRGPHVTPRDWWHMACALCCFLGSLGGLALFMVTELARSAGPPTAAMQVSIMLSAILGMAVFGWLGWKAAVGMTWLHMHWCTWVYPAWRRKDAAWARRIPVLRHLLPIPHVWMSRDVLVLGALLLAFGAHTWPPYGAFAIWRLLLGLAARGDF